MWFQGWGEVWRVVAATVVTFVAIVALLRLVGAQAIAQMSGYDMVATVTFGSIVATVALTRTISIAEGMAALGTLIGLQELLRWFQSRFLVAHHAVRQPPIVLLWEGELLDDRLRAHRISADEVRAAVRHEGFASLAAVRVVVLENDGGWSVIPRDPRGDDSALFGLPIPGREASSPARGSSAAQPAGPYRLP